MIIKKMTATFGKLEGAVLELKEGLNVLQLPNEGGKSTWCAFLRAMFYGIPTRERDTRTTLAEKNRYAPWSGSPMAGELLLTWGGRDIRIRRFAKGTAPFGGFEAVEADTGEAVPGLTAANCGERLLGVSREVWQRSAFVGESAVALDADPELERRIAALVSSGEEDVSFSETEKTLRGWLNRRRHNKTGLIPQLEGELAALEGAWTAARQNQRRLREARAQAESLERRKEELEAEREAQRARRDWAALEQYTAADQALRKAREELAALEGEALPGREALRKAQGDLAYYHTLAAGVKEALGQREPVRAQAEAAEAAAVDPLFPALSPDEAWKQAGGDAAKVRDLEKSGAAGFTGAGAVCLLAAAGFAAAGVLLETVPFFFAAAGFVAAGAVFLLTARRTAAKRRAERAELLERYGARFPDDILDRANAYREKWTAAEEARRNAEALERSIRDLQDQREALWRELIAFVHGFAPQVTDPFGVSAALSRALSREERLSTARVKVEGAQKLVDSLPVPTEENNVILARLRRTGEEVCPEPPPVEHSPQQTAAALSAVTGELQRVREELSHAQGQSAALGEAEELEHRMEEVRTALDRRRREYAALETALEVLGEANGDLQSRFSPRLNQRAGELFSALSGGRYQEVALTRELEAAARETGAVLPRRALTLSRGTVDQLYLAVRLAVCQLALPEEDPSPLVLDDALINFDDARMALALDCLKDLARERQILLFTCHGREGARLEG